MFSSFLTGLFIGAFTGYFVAALLACSKEN